MRRDSHWSEALLAAPEPRSLRALANHPVLRDSAKLVIWLDDLPRFLPPAGELFPSVLSQLLDRPGSTVILATLRSEQRELLLSHESNLVRSLSSMDVHFPSALYQLSDRPGSSIIPALREREVNRDVRVVLDRAVSIELRSTQEDSDEQAKASAVYPEITLQRKGLAEMLAGAPALLRRYRDAPAADPLLYSVVKTCVDWTRCGLGRPLPHRQLIKFARSMLEEYRPDLDPSNYEIDQAIHRARQTLAGGGQVALLSTQRLADRSPAYRAFEYLVAADDGQGDETLKPVDDATWTRFLNAARNADAAAIGYAAYKRENIAIAIAAYRRAAEAGDPHAQSNLGAMLAGYINPPNFAEARLWFERSADAGYLDVLPNLAKLLAESGDMAGARSKLETAIELGDAGLIANASGYLATLLADQGDYDGARSAYQRAIDLGEPGLAFHTAIDLGLMFKVRGDLDGALSAFQQAAGINVTDPVAKSVAIVGIQMINALRNGRTLAGEEFLTAGGYDNNATVAKAAISFAGMLLENEDSSGARSLLDAVIQSEYTDSYDISVAALMLGSIQHDQRDIVNAEHSYLLSIERSEDVGVESLATAALGGLRESQGDRASAREAYQKSIDLGGFDPRAMVHLASILEEDGDRTGAQTVLELAIKSDDEGIVPVAAHALGLMRREHGDLDGAILAFRRASEFTNSESAATAAGLLGIMLGDRGDIKAAKPLLQQAIDSGIPDVVPEAAYHLGMILSKPDPGMMLGKQGKRRNDHDEAEAAFHLAIDTPNSTFGPQAKNGLGLLLIQRANLLRLVHCFRK